MNCDKFVSTRFDAAAKKNRRRPFFFSAVKMQKIATFLLLCLISSGKPLKRSLNANYYLSEMA